MRLQLSRRTAWSLEPSRYARAVAAAQQQQPQQRLLDLACANPTRLDFEMPTQIEQALQQAYKEPYAPVALGLAAAREAVAAYYARRGIAVDPDRVWLCASTSEAYGQLFALLLDRGDTLACPRPGYPLIDHLATIADVRQVHYDLHYQDSWCMGALPSVPVRAVLTVAPGNPTGHVPNAAELDRLAQLCRQRDAAMLIDEVFADYPLDADASALRARLPADDVPMFVLGGLSKACGLPHLKLAWVIAHGPATLMQPALRRVEVISDALLNVASPVQHALPTILTAAQARQDDIRARVRHNLAQLDQQLVGTAVSRLRSDGGWTAVLRLPQLDLTDLEWALRILDAGVRVQPGYLFDLAGPPKIVVSLLTAPKVFARALTRICEVVQTATQPGC